MKLHWAIAFGMVWVALPVSANCADRIASLEVVEPPMQRLWKNLQQQTQFPWGTAQPYQKMTEGKIELSAAFEPLTGVQKQQVLELLKLGYGNNWFELLTPLEQQAALNYPGMGALSPYEVVGSDSRTISMPYDGCTRMTLLTEKDRFSWYYNRSPRESAQAQALLRNSGRPPWRKVRFEIAPAIEKDIRLKFWRSVGFAKANQGWWIAWVPELGHFEINVPQPYNPKNLLAFWRIASTQYRYRVVATDGTPLSQR
jgi:hypothetical protein